MAVNKHQTFWVILDRRGKVLAREDAASESRKQAPWLFGSRNGVVRMISEKEGETLARVRLEFLE